MSPSQRKSLTLLLLVLFSLSCSFGQERVTDWVIFYKNGGNYKAYFRTRSRVVEAMKTRQKDGYLLEWLSFSENGEYVFKSVKEGHSYISYSDKIPESLQGKLEELVDKRGLNVVQVVFFKGGNWAVLYRENDRMKIAYQGLPEDIVSELKKKNSAGQAAVRIYAGGKGQWILHTMRKGKDYFSFGPKLEENLKKKLEEVSAQGFSVRHVSITQQGWLVVYYGNGKFFTVFSGLPHKVEGKLYDLDVASSEVYFATFK